MNLPQPVPYREAADNCELEAQLYPGMTALKQLFLEPNTVLFRVEIIDRESALVESLVVDDLLNELLCEV